MKIPIANPNHSDIISVFLYLLEGDACFFGLLPALVGGMILRVGVQNVLGTARDTLGNATGSIVIGALGMGVEYFLPLSFHDGPIHLLVVIGAACGGGLIAAGLLALAGRRDYLDWRQVHMALRQKFE